jgi:hypothetical protein
MPFTYPITSTGCVFPVAPGTHDHILLYCPSGPQRWKEVRNRLSSNYAGHSNPDNDSKGPWRSIRVSAQGFRLGFKLVIKSVTDT